MQASYYMQGFILTCLCFFLLSCKTTSKQDRFSSYRDHIYNEEILLDYQDKWVSHGPYADKVTFCEAEIILKCIDNEIFWFSIQKENLELSVNERWHWQEKSFRVVSIIDNYPFNSANGKAYVIEARSLNGDSLLEARFIYSVKVGLVVAQYFNKGPYAYLILNSAKGF